MDFHLPELGEGVLEAELVSWLVKPGDVVKRGQNLMEVLTDKATMEVPAPFAGTIGELKAKPGESIKVGDPVLTYTAVGKTAERAKAPATEAVAATSAAPRHIAGGNGPVVPPRHAAVAVKAAPSVRLLARKLGIDLGNLPGSGPGGRILLEDLSPQLQPSAAQKPAKSEAKPDYGKPGTRMKLQGIRRKIADHMVQAKRAIPHYSYIDECDVTDLVRLRESLKETYAKSGVKLTYLAFFVKAVVAALREVPIVNSSLDEATGEIVLHDHYHIGVAVAAAAGLIVPVVHDADKKDLAHIAQDIERLSTDARAGKSRLEDLRGSTFTVTSIGNVGGLMSTPVINHPEAAILGLGKIVKRPIFDAAGNIKPADIVYLSFSFDHRILDGAIGAAFSNVVLRNLQNPATLLLSERLV